MSKNEIKQARELYQQWRDTHQRETPIAVRRMVVALGKRHGDKVISRELGVSSASLWKWRSQLKAEAKSASKVERVKRSADRKGLQFVEVKPAGQMMPASSDVRIEWQRADGHLMRVEGRASFEQLIDLLLRFLGGGVQ